MSFLRNLLALLGLVAILGGAYAYMTYKPMYDEYKPMLPLMEEWDIKGLMALKDELDPKAPEVYKSMLKRLIETKNSAAATVWKYPVAEGLTVEDVEMSMMSIASEHGIKSVGELPLSKQVELTTGEKQRFMKIYLYCNPMTAMMMVNYMDDYSAYLPCRISLVEDKEGKLWLYSLDMDMMVWGGATLPDDLLKEATQVRFIIKDMMERAAAGDF